MGDAAGCEPSHGESYEDFDDLRVAQPGSGEGRGSDKGGGNPLGTDSLEFKLGSYHTINTVIGLESVRCGVQFYGHAQVDPRCPSKRALTCGCRVEGAVAVGRLSSLSLVQAGLHRRCV